MAHPPRDQAVVHKESLGEDWLEVGGGRFGRVFKVRHKVMGVDVAIKVLREDARFVIEEAKFMDLSSFEFVLRVYEIYEGPSGEKGLVTEYMKMGSVGSLQKKLSGPWPWPLTFRLAHQIALAMNFIHKKKIVHLDLKPNNILLTDELNARVADFGLSAMSTSATGHSNDPPTGPRGTLKYFPPEAFDLSYKPVRAFDIYSFSIVLWTIFSGEEPYPMGHFDLVKLNRRQRPPCENLLSLQVDGIKELVELMVKCWVEHPNERPSFDVIHTTTEELFSRHSSNIQLAVYEVLIKLASPNQAQHLKPLNENHGAQPNDFVDVGFVRDGKQVPSDGDSRETMTRDKKELDVVGVKQASSEGNSRKTMTTDDKTEFVDRHRAAIIQKVTRALAIADDLGPMVHRETYSIIRAKQVPQDQVRELYEILKAGKRVQEAFYDALMKNESSLMEELHKIDSKAVLQ